LIENIKMAAVRFFRFFAVTFLLGTDVLFPSLVAGQVEEVEVTAAGDVRQESAASENTPGVDEDVKRIQEETASAPVIPSVDEAAEPVQQEDPSSGTPSIDPNCPDRDHLMRCARVHLDLNKNNKIDRDELDAAINSLPW
jgi:hypothetical protein